LPDIGLVIEKLMGSGYVSEYSKREFKAKYYRYLCKKSAGNSNALNSSRSDGDKEENYNFPYNELLIWAVLMKRHKMALFLCKRGEETLAKVNALF
jgi:transient receptor potential cation channel subfamily M protein 3